MNIANNLAGLSLLTGTDAYSSYLTSLADAPKVETAAQRKAHATFTLPTTAAPWKQAPSTTPEAQRVTEINAMKTVIDTPSSADKALPTDVLTTFTAYKALDRLQVLADTAAKDTTSSASRATMQKAFAKGLADLKTYLAGASSSQLNLAYARSARDVRTTAVAAPSSLTAPTITGKGVSSTRTAALTGVTGNERFSISLSDASGAADNVTVDLSTGPQPPTLDSVSDAINVAIKAVPRKDVSGNIVRDTNGDPVPRWGVSVQPTKTGDKWGLSLNRAGFETVSIDQIAAPDTVLVASGLTGTDTTKPVATSTRLTRFDSPDGTPVRTTLGTISATDALATARSALAADADPDHKLVAETVGAAVSSDAIATDAQGFSYVVGTTAGDTAGNLEHGKNDLLLTKVDSEGTVVWQRSLGAAGTAQGSAVSIAPDGGIVVAGSVTGMFDGANSDGDVLVARYDPQGNESFSTLVRSVGVQTSSAIAVGADGSIYVGGQTDKGGGSATITRLDAKGAVKDSRLLPGTGLRALAVDGQGKLLALTSQNGQASLRKIDAGALSTDIATLDLGRADARAIAVGGDGTIAVVGATEAALSSTKVSGTNTTSGGLDGFVARIDSGLAAASVTYLGTGASDQADSVSFLGDNLYVGGRTTGVMSGKRTGDVDAFVARLDAGTGMVSHVDQFGVVTTKAEPVRVSAIAGGDTVLGALGLHRGTLTPTDSATLEAQSSLRTGDEFSVKVNNGATRKITIDEGETLTSLTTKVSKLLGTTVASVTNPSKGTGRMLAIAAKPGVQIQLIPGADGKDALGKLGLDAKRISAPATPDKGTPTVTPGGAFGLDLDDGLAIDTKVGATVALSRIKQAVSYTQSAYRSLYWDDTKAQLAEPVKASGKTGASTAIEQAQIANYQAALTRLSSSSTTGFGF